MGSNSPKISVIVITYNSEPFLSRCLNSIMRSDYGNLDITVVDNKSTDASCELIENEYPSVRLIRNTRNLGFGDAANLGIRETDGSLILLLNPDIELERSCLKNLAGSISRDPRVALAGCKAMKMKRREIIDFAWSTFGWPKLSRDQSIVHSVAFGNNLDIKIHGQNQKDNEYWSATREVGAVLGGSMMIKRELLEKPPLFDTMFFLYREDNDVCLRAWKSGLKVLYIGTAVAYRDDHSPGRNPTLVQRNRLLFVVKSFSRKELANWAGYECGHVLRLFVFGVFHRKYARRTRSLWLPLTRAYFYLVTNLPVVLEGRSKQSRGVTGFIPWAVKNSQTISSSSHPGLDGS